MRYYKSSNSNIIYRVVNRPVVEFAPAWECKRKSWLRSKLTKEEFENSITKGYLVEIENPKIINHKPNCQWNNFNYPNPRVCTCGAFKKKLRKRNK